MFFRVFYLYLSELFSAVYSHMSSSCSQFVLKFMVVYFAYWDFLLVDVCSVQSCYQGLSLRG